VLVLDGDLIQGFVIYPHPLCTILLLYKNTGLAQGEVLGLM
jgi:hypothetical protein